MERYLNMSSYFVGSVSINTDGQICDGKYFRGSTDIAEDYYSPICHAINSHDELVAMNKELLEALEGLLSDMRLRAKLDGDIDSDGCVVLNCGNGVLHAANMAIAKAKGNAS